MSTMNRRRWLFTTGLMTAGAALRPGLTEAANQRLQGLVTDSLIRLHSNENPFGPSDAARAAMQAAFDKGSLYPSGFYGQLKALIAEKEGLTPDHVLLGAGSHEVLRMAGYAYGLHGGEVVVGHPTYEGMGVYAEAVGATVHRVPLNADMHLDLDAMDRQTTGAVKMVFVCNPNNPTGMVLPADHVRAFCSVVSRRAVVFVDEAYHEYVEHPDYASMVDLVKAGERVVISRTFSKIFGLAGLRVGYALARPDLIEEMAVLQTRQAINVLGIHAALAAYRDKAYITRSRDENKAARQLLYAVLEEQGVRFLPSQTNFVFFHLGRDIGGFQQDMRAKGILVGRPFPPFTDWCRLSIGTTFQMQAFAEAFKSLG